MQSVFSNGGVIGATLDLTSTAEYTDHASGTTTGYLEPVYVGGGIWTASTLSTSQTVTIPELSGGIATAPSEGDVVFVAIGLSATADYNLGITGTWIELFDLYSSDTEDAQLSFQYKRMGATPDTSLTLTSSTSNTGVSPIVLFHVWRNLDATNPIDASNSVSATSQSTLIPTFGAVTPITPNSVILAAAVGASVGAPSEYTSSLSNFLVSGTNDTEDAVAGLGSYSDWVSGSYTPDSWGNTSDSTSSSYASVTIALKPALGSIPVYNKKNSGLWNLESIFDSKAAEVLTVEYLVIAGGGASDIGNDSGGGGAGGYRSSVSGESSGGGASAESPLTLTPNTAYTVTVGAGGASGGNGSNSVFHTVTSLGGGKGSDGTGSQALAGGSGGGGGDSSNAGASGTAGQGFAGGNGNTDGAGGGGAGGAGNTNGTGGAGVTSLITGTATARAGGGGGGVDAASSTATAGGGAGSPGTIGSAGTANTGGGGGGSGQAGTAGAAGGSGVVIIRYPAGRTTPTISAGLTATTTTVGNYKVTEFTAGTGTVTF